MHELAVCQSLLREVERTAQANGSGQVTRIVAGVGPLSGIEAPLLERAFTVARAGTLAAAATLEIETMPVIVWCKTCGIETAVAGNALLCGKCADWRVELRSGDQLLLTRVELTVEAEASGRSDLN